MTQCEEPGCDKEVPDHKWGKIKAVGWLFLKNGKAYCPGHLPAWYEEWKAKKNDP